jgi:hypothetical protein
MGRVLSRGCVRHASGRPYLCCEYEQRREKLKSMKIPILLFFFTINYCFAQELELKLIKQAENTKGGNTFALKVFNNLDNPIGIKCSIGLNKFSEADTLQLAIGPWYENSDSICYYSINRALLDARISEEISRYQLILVNPQTYFSTNICLTDMGRCKSVKFSLYYSTKITKQELEIFGNRATSSIKAINDDKHFLSKTVDIK